MFDCICVCERFANELTFLIETNDVMKINIHSQHSACAVCLLIIHEFIWKYSDTNDHVYQFLEVTLQRLRSVILPQHYKLQQHQICSSAHLTADGNAAYVDL